MTKEGIIYILGSGRSGSTILATVLGDHTEINSVGELHHFFHWAKKGGYCACGRTVDTCIYWGQVLGRISEETINNYQKNLNLCRKIEYHTSIPLHLFGGLSENDLNAYQKLQIELFNAVGFEDTAYVLDSAKYIGRFLALKTIFQKKIKGIYLVRDLRGVIWSFNKAVQTQSSPLRTITYYLYINFWGQLLTFLLPKDQILKIRYEDIVENPRDTFNKIGKYLGLDLTSITQKIENGEYFKIPHVVEGNRLIKNNHIKIEKDNEWVKGMTALRKKIYFLTALPLMIINKYCIIK